MGRTKGTSKTGGRQAGTPNRLTQDVRLWIYGVIQDNMDTLEADLKTMDAEKRWAIIEKMLPYVVTKREPRTVFTWEFEDGDKLSI